MNVWHKRHAGHDMTIVTITMNSWHLVTFEIPWSYNCLHPGLVSMSAPFLGTGRWLMEPDNKLLKGSASVWICSQTQSQKYKYLSKISKTFDQFVKHEALTSAKTCEDQLDWIFPGVPAADEYICMPAPSNRSLWRLRWLQLLPRSCAVFWDLINRLWRLWLVSMFPWKFCKTRLSMIFMPRPASFKGLQGGRFERPAQKWQSANWDVASTNGLIMLASILLSSFCSFQPAVLC